MRMNKDSFALGKSTQKIRVRAAAQYFDSVRDAAGLAI
ncbi:hypothetical protein BSU04_39070 [Caballeronia sordidicola]|uniref:Uncharacterized protein n=1 Tax=Caballeronia sordidicola TaxID=196367 RepID=A0A226WP13_CABSO|nr:hypothetical protein BSU04_39070 [Caballeronia sordidicola]